MGDNTLEMMYVPKDAYEQLVKDSAILDALYAAGVDNWEGYEEAMSILEEWEAEDEDEG